MRMNVQVGYSWIWRKASASEKAVLLPELPSLGTEKELSDPDYDRNYVRYVKSVPSGQCFSMAPFDVQKFQPSYVHYDAVFPQLGQMPNAQASPNYRNPALGPYHAMRFNQTSNDGVFMQWPTQSMIYAHSCDQVRHAFFQPAFCQQPLSFGYSQNHN